MNVPLEMIEKQNPLSNTSMEGELTLINSKKQILYSTNQENWGKTAEPMPQSEADQYIKIKDVGTSGAKTVYVLSNKDMTKELQEINNQIYVVMVAAIILTIMVCLFIYRIFNRQVQTLLHSMQQVQAGDFSLQIPIKSKDEIGVISQAFNEMCERLNSYISEVYAAEIQRKNAELNALQTR